MVLPCIPCRQPTTTQTFKERLIDVMDQAHHFGALGASAGGAPGGSGHAGEDFREGLDGTERECEFYILGPFKQLTLSIQ